MWNFPIGLVGVTIISTKAISVLGGENMIDNVKYDTHKESGSDVSYSANSLCTAEFVELYSKANEANRQLIADLLTEIQQQP